MRISSPAACRLRLRVQLVRLRMGVGLSQQQVAGEMGWSTAKVMRIEAGSVGVSRDDLISLLGLYQVNDLSEGR
jgi:transcriptional regulator with XRE-family HTH domain